MIHPDCDFCPDDLEAFLRGEHQIVLWQDARRIDSSELDPTLFSPIERKIWDTIGPGQSMCDDCFNRRKAELETAA